MYTLYYIYTVWKHIVSLHNKHKYLSAEKSIIRWIDYESTFDLGGPIGVDQAEVFTFRGG